MAGLDHHAGAKETGLTLKDEFAEQERRAPARLRGMLDRQLEALGQSSVRHTMLRQGARSPAIVLPNARGQTINVDVLAQSGPVIVSFYRGAWCPYCNLELRAYQSLLGEIKSAGASLVAISPETPDNALTTEQKNGLEFEVLSDVGLKVARAFGIVFDVTDELRDAYREGGLDFETMHGAPGEWSLPLAATYVIGRDGKILFAYAELDHHDRAEPREVVKLLRR